MDAEPWRKALRMYPPMGLADENPSFFKKSVFEALVPLLKREGYGGSEANRLAFPAAALFQSEQRVAQYLEKWGEAGPTPLHDLIEMIRLPKEGHPNLKDWGDAVLKCGPSMARLVKFADRIPSPCKSDDGRTWSMVKTRAECATFAFNHAAEHPELAALCMAYNVDNDDFEKALKLVKKGAPEEKNIPEIVIDGSNFDMKGARFHRLPANDIRGLFLGEITGCCQSIGGHGHECAKHGFTSKDSGFYVIENAKGDIIAQTWAWRGKQGEMCFDSLEALGDQVSDGQWKTILEEAAKELTAREDRHDVTALHVGIGGRTPRSLRQNFQSAAAFPRGYDGYRDSKDLQIRVWKR
jgi:hypothetical protein